MQTPTVRAAVPSTSFKSSSASNGPKSKKKKAPPPSKNLGKNKEAATSVGPQPVVPPPLSGPWGKPKPVSNSAPPPGFGPSSSSSSSSGLSDTHVRLLRHRALFAFRFLIGKAVEVQLVASDERYVGVLDCVDPDDFSIVLKSTKRLSCRPDAKAFEDGSTVILRRHQLAHLVADGTVNYTDGVFASGATATTSEFRTDTEISGQKGEQLYGRELETASSWLDPALDTGALEDSESQSRRKGTGMAGWNQFEANEKLFGVVSTFDENIYTTKLDTSKISSEQLRAAEKLAQEIERQSAAGNFHLQEERGQTARTGKHVNDLDEEARYSSVDRRGASSSEKAYVPPALRNTQHRSSADKLQEKVTPTGPFDIKSTPTNDEISTPTPSNGETLSSTPPVAPPVHKPLSFSEAVTGRSAAATAALHKIQPGEKEEVLALSNEVQEDGKGMKTADSVKEDLPEHNRGQKKGKSEDYSLSTTTTIIEAEEAPKPALKKGLNPNAKEFKLSASAAPFTPTFAVPSAVKHHTSSPYRGGSPGHAPYLHPGMIYPPPVQEEWMYDGLNGEDGGGMGMPPYGYGVPMGPTGVPILYPPMIHQQNMHVMSGQTGGYGYQQHGYTPQGYYSPPNSGFPPYAGGTLVSPPLPPTPISSKTSVEDAVAPNGLPASDVKAASLEPSSASEK